MGLLRQRFGRSLLNIFNHYVDMATRRRAQEDVADKERVAAQMRRLADQGRGQEALAHDKIRQQREADRRQNAHVHRSSNSNNNTMDSSGGAVTSASGGASCASGGGASSSSSRSHSIGHKEFFQFCQDFKLKSSALLSAIQVGEVYLTAAPLDDGSCSNDGTSGENDPDNGQTQEQQQQSPQRGESGRNAADRILAAQRNRYMDFDRFLRSIMLMSLLAYRDVHARVLPIEKTKALLLYMWRAINSREKTEQAVNSRYGASKLVEGHAGSLNVHGSGMFSVTLQEMWKDDGFSSYVTKSDQRAGGHLFPTGSPGGREGSGADDSGPSAYAGSGYAVDIGEEEGAGAGNNNAASSLLRTSWRRSARSLVLQQQQQHGGGSPVSSPGGRTGRRGAGPDSPMATKGNSSGSGGTYDPFGCAEMLALSGLTTSLEQLHLPHTPRALSPPTATATYSSSTGARKQQGRPAVRGAEVSELFRRRPELAEFVYLELLSSPSVYA